MTNTEKLASSSMLLVKQALMQKLLTSGKDLGKGLLQGGKAGLKELVNLPMTGLKGFGKTVNSMPDIKSKAHAIGQGTGAGLPLGLAGAGAVNAPFALYDSGKSNGVQEGKSQGVNQLLELLKKQKTEQGYGSRLLDALLNKGY